MNPIEIEEQLSKLASVPFDGAEFPFQFLECFGNKATNTKSLRKGKANKALKNINLRELVLVNFIRI